MKNISKSRFVSGVQCSKKIYFDYHRKDLKPPVDEAQQRIFDLGHHIGFLAQKAFPNGVDVSPEDYSNFSKSIKDTQDLINSKNSIYEATFSSKNTLVMLDILEHKNGKWNALEVKNSTSVKDYHLTDAAFQYFVMTQTGFTPDRFYLMHINNQYVKNGEITTELFHLEDITDIIIEKQTWVAENLDCLLQIIQSEKEPDVKIGGHCGNPFACEYQHHCWSHVPENSVFELNRAGAKAWDLYHQNILAIDDIPEDYPLTNFQTLQVRGSKFGEKYIDVSSIQNFIDKWQFPLYFFDFETIFPAIPVLDGTRPYEQVPFQYSLHQLDEQGNLKHFEFLADPNSFHNSSENPLKSLIHQMKIHFGNHGSIVAYNMTFEKKALTSLAEKFPEDREFLEEIISRMVDLMVIFQKNWYYDPQMGKSYSIKAVLPALIPELTYKDLEVSNGDLASSLFHDSIKNGEFLNENLKNNLLEYCKLDTYAMVVLWQFLKNLNG